MLYVPDFKYNLLSVQRLSRENGCNVIFENTYCLILDVSTEKLKGIGKVQNGLYYLVDQAVNSLAQSMIPKHSSANTTLQIPHVIQGYPLLPSSTLWHNRLGHAPLENIKRIQEFSTLQSS